MLRVHLFAELTAASWMLEPFGKVGTNFTLQLSAQLQFAEIKNKKILTENQ